MLLLRNNTYFYHQNALYDISDLTFRIHLCYDKDQQLLSEKPFATLTMNYELGGKEDRKMEGVSSLKIQRTIPMLIVVLALTRIAAVGETIHIDISGQADFDNIQAGIDAANDGDTLLVGPGEYVISEPITFRGKAITVISEAGPYETTIRMGTPADTNRGSVVIFESNETTASVLDGFTITGGRGCGLWFAKVGEAPRFWWEGGGIGFNASSGTVRNCAIVQNRADVGGAVMVVSGSSAFLINCIINKNSATDSEGAGGGLCSAGDSSVTMTKCVIRDNSTLGAGGGVVSYDNSFMTMTNCEIINNTAERFGGGIYVKNASTTLRNCVIARNTGGWGGGGVGTSGGSYYGPPSFIEIANCTITGNFGAADAGGGGMVSYGAGSIGAGSITITNSIICGNTSAKGPEISLMGGEKISTAYSNVAGGQSRVNVEGGSTFYLGPGNIDADPCFTDPDNDDYHLKSEAGRWDSNSQLWSKDGVTSLCIDAGDPDSDWKAELWPHGIRANMGAYGGTFQASRSLLDAGNIADLNRDGIVDSEDVCMMVDYWHTDEPYCDIAPAPFGDGIVDIQDMAILGENLFEDYRKDLAMITMIAYWELNEAAGAIAYDSINNHDGTLHGDPIWQPNDGQVAGALKFDGIDDYIDTDFVLNPADGPFSAFVWVKGGEPGQVIISQSDGIGSGETWLGMDVQDGKFMTELVSPPVGRFKLEPLVSQVVITDDQWHHVGLVWDGSYRFLYVDSTEVAKDTSILTQPIMSSNGDLYIGAGKNLDEGTFFSGLIDDVCIYDKALSVHEIAALAR
jgi:hypothetical protein